LRQGFAERFALPAITASFARISGPFRAQVRRSGGADIVTRRQARGERGFAPLTLHLLEDALHHLLIRLRAAIRLS
jgi:hypothetical protein